MRGRLGVALEPPGRPRGRHEEDLDDVAPGPERLRRGESREALPALPREGPRDGGHASVNRERQVVAAGTGAGDPPTEKRGQFAVQIHVGQLGSRVDRR